MNPFVLELLLNGINLVLIQFLVVLVQLRPLRHSAYQLPRPVFPDLHVFIYYLVLALVAQLVQQLVAFDVGLYDLTISFHELHFPQLLERAFREE